MGKASFNNDLTSLGVRYKISDMKKLLSTFLILGSLFAVTDASAYVEKKTAAVRIMSKAAGKSQTVALPVGAATNYEKLSLTVRTCKQTDPFQPEDFFMFIEVVKNPDGKIFSGWMSKNEPGDNPLQNADYDLWLVKCE
ncbi:MAG: DUF2155 domain-containing protein [Rickettsiales bacterium]|jgi:hypothetical protein|nr:DUF2155 domain-containing protein [Rickettsiales bacterium]